MTTITIERIREALKKHAAAKTLAEAWILADENEDALSVESLTEVLAHIDQLRAEIHASDLAVAEYRQQCLDNAQEIARLRAESEERLQNCVALAAENERLRKDAERYQFIRKKTGAACGTKSGMYPDLKTVAYMHADCNDFVSVSPYSYADHRELVVRSDVIEGYEAMRRDAAFWRASLDAVLKDRPAAAPEPVAWINGHDLRLLGRQGRGALVWCDKEGHADTPLYLHPPATAPEQPSWHDAPTAPGVWFCDEGDICYTWTAHNIEILDQFDPGDGLRWFGPIPEDNP